MKGKVNRIYVEPGIWLNYFRIVFDINKEVGTILEIQIGRPPYIEEINRKFIKGALKDSFRKRKKNTATGVEGLPAEVLTLRRLMSYIYIYIYIWSTHF